MPALPTSTLRPVQLPSELLCVVCLNNVGSEPACCARFGGAGAYIRVLSKFCLQADDAAAMSYAVGTCRLSADQQRSDGPFKAVILRVCPFGVCASPPGLACALTSLRPGVCSTTDRSHSGAPGGVGKELANGGVTARSRC